MSGIQSIPEIAAIDGRKSLIRIPGEQDVPVTPRIRKLIDSAPFQRLNSIGQLGLVSLVYPGARHTRFEHSLGAYRMCLLFLKRLATDPPFAEAISPEDAERLIVASLLHDVGHWPYCHPIEDMDLKEVPEHESLAIARLQNSEVPDILSRFFSLNLKDVTNLLSGNYNDPTNALLGSILSGPVDIDKMDYLYRDSLHAGVPYGMHYDRGRLIGSLCLDKDGNSLAITEKGVTAAELMVFARYVMFREVYWHHTVRSATAMLQRAIHILRDHLSFESVFSTTDLSFQQLLCQQAAHTPAEGLVAGIFGHQRRLYKRLAQFTVLNEAGLFNKISRRSYAWLVTCAHNFAAILRELHGVPVQEHDILIDAPPVGLEVQFQIPVRDRRGHYRMIGDVSPVVHTLATEQFDNFVKRVRIFANPEFPELLTSDINFAELLNKAIEMTDAQQGS